MKIKRKKLSLILLVLLILSIFSGCNTNTEIQNSETGEKWLLTYEKKVLYDGSMKSEKTYTYNSSGLLIESTAIEYDDEYNTQENNYYSYDGANNLSHRISEIKNLATNELSSTRSYEYDYDSKNNCISEKITDSNGETQIYYEYDKNGNCTFSKTTDSDDETLMYYEYDEHSSVTKITEKYYSSDEYAGEAIYTHNYLYDDGLCIEEEYLADCTNSPVSSLSGLVISTYTINTYDENRNITVQKNYTDLYLFEREEIERNEKKFGLFDTVYYSYTKLSDLTSTSSSSAKSQTTSNSVTTTDPYNGLPAPVELKIVNSNGKKAMKNDTSYEMDYSMYLIEDYHGLKYLVLTCSATSKYSDRKANGPDFFPVTITKSNMELTYDLDDEVKQAYDEIIFSGYLDTTLYPGEVVKDSYIYDFYGEKENITVVLQPSLHGNVTNGSNNNYIHGIYTGNYSFSENKWDEYIFLEFAF